MQRPITLTIWNRTTSGSVRTTLVKKWAAGPAFSRDGDATPAKETFDIDAMAAKGADYERLDQMLIDVLLGAQ